MFSKPSGKDSNDDIKSARTKSLYPPTHAHGQADKYTEYLMDDGKLEASSKNPRNLFHESNRLDSKWLRVARMYLTRRNRSQQ